MNKKDIRKITNAIEDLNKIKRILNDKDLQDIIALSGVVIATYTLIKVFKKLEVDKNK